jgi:hypothetical protein
MIATEAVSTGQATADGYQTKAHSNNAYSLYNEA